MKRRQFLTETVGAIGALSIGNYADLLAEEKDDIFSTVVLKVECVSSLNRVHPRLAATKAVDNFEYGTMFMYGEFWDNAEYAHRKDTVVRLENLSHEIKRLYMKGDYLIADVRIMDTPRGRILKDLIAKDKNSISFRPYGTAKGEFKTENGIYVIENYELLGIDAMFTTVASKW